MGEKTLPGQALVGMQFDYTQLEPKTANRARAAAVRIRAAVKRTIEDIIEVGFGLTAVKEILPHGQFGPWLKAEFGWGDRMARNFMAVAEQFGPKTEIIADLRIQPTAAYILAAPSVPDEARTIAVERAQAGEVITTKAAKAIVKQTRLRDGEHRWSGFERQLPCTFERTMQNLQKNWDPDNLDSLVGRLREFADSIERLLSIRDGISSQRIKETEFREANNKRTREARHS